MDCLGESHEGGGGRAGEGAADILDALKVVAKEKQLRDSDSNDGRQRLADECISRLRERRLYGVEFEDSSRTKRTDNSGRMVALKGGNVGGGDLDNDDGAKDTNKGPKGGHEVARVGGLGSAMAEKMGDRIRNISPWRRRDDGIDVAVNVKVPRVMGGWSRHGR